MREGGFAALTVQAVAARAGVAVGTVYRYFGAKDELAAEVFRNATGREVEALAQALQAGESVAERLEKGCRMFVLRAMQAPLLAWSLIAEPVAAALDSERLRYRQAYTALFVDQLELGMQRGELPAQPAAVTAAALVGGLAEALLAPLARQGKRVLVLEDETIDALVAWFLRAAGVGQIGEAL